MFILVRVKKQLSLSDFTSELYVNPSLGHCGEDSSHVSKHDFACKSSRSLPQERFRGASTVTSQSLRGAGSIRQIMKSPHISQGYFNLTQRHARSWTTIAF